MQRVLSTVVLLGLLVASVAAFAITEHLKLIKSPVYDTFVTRAFSPVCNCATAKAEIRFKLREADTVTLTILDSHGKKVDTLASGVHEPKGTVTFYWDGLTQSGTPAPDASGYQPQIDLPGKTILMPNKITLDTVPPKVLSASDGNGILHPGSKHTIAIKYTFSSRATVQVYLDGHRIIAGRHQLPADTVKWAGKRNGKLLPPGRYVLEIAALDAAGNETPPAEWKQVVVRIVSGGKKK